MPKLRNQVTVTGQAGSATAIALSQSVASKTPALINGALGVPYVVPSNQTTITHPGPNPGGAQIVGPAMGQPVNGTAAVLGPPQQVLIASAGNDSGISFTIVGEGTSGERVTEVLVGANIGTATSVNLFTVVYSITPSGATAAAITVGTGAIVYSKWLIGGSQRNDYTTNLEAYATGTVNYDVQATSDPNIMINSGGQADDIFALQAAKTASQQTLLASPWYAYRVKMNSGTGTVVLRAIESRTA